MSKKTAIVTGAAKRIGKAIAEALLANQYRIVAHYRNSKAELDAWAAAYGSDVVLLGADLADASDCRAFIQDAIQTLGQVDLLVNNASTFAKSDAATVSTEDIQNTIMINSIAPFLLMQNLYQDCKSKGYNAHVINLTDTQVEKDESPYFSYLMSKKLLSDISRFTALDWADHLRVNMIAPGWILDAKDSPSPHRHIPMNRQGKLEDISDAVLYLDGQDYISGQTIYAGGADQLQACIGSRHV